jgi:hypothetical protein
VKRRYGELKTNKETGRRGEEKNEGIRELNIVRSVEFGVRSEMQKNQEING